MSTAIKVEDLGKKYTIIHEGKQHYTALRDVLTDSAKSFGSRIIHPFSSPLHQKPASEEFWALKNVSFEVKQGERIGIIGRNGAGKSTLLKLLSRITEPTEGRIRIKGRVSSLLEVGTGFHPELTGRENIYLNGAILGMSKAEINKKYDEIVSFAEVEKFLDTPVKRYSSGMQVRLAFAVAAHLEPEILLVDEVLAVGDAAFQKKCLGKLEGISKGEGRTIIFVSHNMLAIEKLCNRAIMLEGGSIVKDKTNVSEVISDYLGTENHVYKSFWINQESFLENEIWTPLSLSIKDRNGEILSKPVLADEFIFIEIEFVVKEMEKELAIGYCLYDHKHNPLYWSYHIDNGPILLEVGKHTIRSTLPKSIFNEGRYYVQLICGILNNRSILNRSNSDIKISFEILGNRNVATSLSGQGKRNTILAPVIDWSIIENG